MRELPVNVADKSPDRSTNSTKFRTEVFTTLFEDICIKPD
ncbi:hypothetical protein SpAn4DRAFT_2388 [Sporomusa ovata]|uniref:Uncharacterized protein n=1 Tax=Sporomusa ovata TaxID=2378 RepID=A0A0U1L0G5_9FIRM|nr:hypothetical protein SpAn4DRAFT_2388 [Sporomusa ovata]